MLPKKKLRLLPPNNKNLYQPQPPPERGLPPAVVTELPALVLFGSRAPFGQELNATLCGLLGAPRLARYDAKRVKKELRW